MSRRRKDLSPELTTLEVRECPEWVKDQYRFMRDFAPRGVTLRHLYNRALVEFIVTAYGDLGMEMSDELNDLLESERAAWKEVVCGDE